MFQTKVCGITCRADALLASDAGADALGFNFYPRSKRFVEVDTARGIIAHLPSSCMTVGVFVNASREEIATAAEHLQLDAVQLHGDEPAELLAELPASLQVVRAFCVGAQGLSPVVQYLGECQIAGRMPDAILLDADAGKEYGGSGRIADWGRIAEQRNQLGDLPLILAGGLNPENVAAAIAAVSPDGVDVASGVEIEPGRKDAALVRRFMDAARAAFART